jgi:hypothetical protein
MATLTPIEGNPFESRQGGVRLTPVPGNPFSSAPLQNRTFENPEDEALYQSSIAEIKKAQQGIEVDGGPLVPQAGAPRDTRSAEERAMEHVQRLRAKEAEKKAFAESRTVGRRIADTAAFVPSAIVRAATHGEYGIGDVVGAVAPKAGRALAEREGTFARANEAGLDLLGHAGEVAMGIPMLSSMGVPARGISATANAVASRPLPKKSIPRAVVRNERLSDLDAFRNSQVTPFGPAFTDAGLSGAVKQLSEAPLVGAPVRNRLLQTIEQTRDAGERVAGQYGSARTYRDVGNVAERGLDRFKDTRVEKVHGRDAAAPTPDADLSRIAKAPARDTSVKTKADALYERAWRGIPEEMAKGRAKKGDDRFLGGMANTQALLRDISQRNQRMFSATRGNEAVDPKLSYPVRGGVPGQIVEDIIEGRWRGNLQSMRDVRSNFRRLASGISDTERNTLTLSDMRRIQSAMTQDMISVLERNSAKFAKDGNTAKAANVNRAIHDFRRADQFTKASAGRLEAIEKLYGAQSAEQLGLNVLKDAMGGTKGGNLQRLTALRRSLREDEWGDVASGVIRELGRPVGSARGATEEVGFSVNSFITKWNNMSPEGKTVLFKGAHTRELGKALDDFVRVADRMANFEALANTSRSATNALGVGGLLSVIAAAQQAFAGNLQGAISAGSAAAGLYGFGRFMTSPLYVRWLTRATELSGQPGKTKALRVHAQELARLAEKEPDGATKEIMASIAYGLGQSLDRR